MKRQIRNHVFETNSSMTHALTICTEEEYRKWKDGELLYDYWNEELVKPEDKDSEDDEDYPRYLNEDNYYERTEYFEHFKHSFSSPNGDEMIAFGYYGHD